VHISRQPTERKMLEYLAKILQSGLSGDAAKKEQAKERESSRPQPFIFHFEPEDEAFRFRLQFKKSHVSRDELIRTLREILSQLEGAGEADSTAA
jgi:hypothetical protein